MSEDFFWLSDEQFARISPCLPTDTRGKPRVDDRRVISGIIHVIKSGGRWITRGHRPHPFQNLCDTPKIGRQTEKDGVYVLVLSSIPFKIFYEIDADMIVILSVFHTSRDPGDME